MKSVLYVFLITILLGSCQKLGLYRYGIGEKEIYTINETHRRSCKQPVAQPVGLDKCGRPLYGVGTK